MPRDTLDTIRTADDRTRSPRDTSRANDTGASSARRIAVDPGDVEDIRVLDEAGRVVDEAAIPDLSRDDLLRVHRAMVLTRKFDVRMLNMQRQGKMGTFAPGLGQEATQIGQVFPLTASDWYAPSYRSFGAQIWRGWPMDQLMLLWDGFFEGFPPPPQVNDLPFSIVIGSHVLPAVGVAMGIRHRGDDAVMLTNFGDGALSQGAIAEALNFAAVNRAPVVFMCENNGWAISTPVDEQCAHDVLAQRGLGFGIPSVRVDGNDILAMITATELATRRARAGEGPTFIEAVTYRMSVHTTADDPKVYRSDDEVDAWNAKCPIARFERYLQHNGILDAAACADVAEACEREVLDARERFYERAIRNPQEIFDFIYEDLPPDLERQKQEYLTKLKRKGIT